LMCYIAHKPFAGLNCYSSISYSNKCIFPDIVAYNNL
jgi:hypothetical protein